MPDMRTMGTKSAPQATYRLSTVLFVLFAVCPGAAVATELSAGTATSPHPARLAGIRFGQAIGAAAVCSNIHLQPAAEALARRFTGDDLERFKTEAERVAEAWRQSLVCKTAADINRCRVLSEKSCSEALREIGPEGTAVRGLIEFRGHDRAEATDLRR